MGEVIFTLIDTIEPKVLPVILQFHGASDTQIGVIVGSLNVVLQLLIMPPLGYYSDRLRTRWGRRIPLLFLATPVACIFLAITPFSPEIASALGQSGHMGALLRAIPVKPVILTFAVMVVLYRMAQTVMNTTFFGLLRDVVPDTHMGRFLAFFRLFGAAGTFIVTYWLIGHAERHSQLIFIGLAAISLVAFGAICWFVKEGEYPPVEKETSPSRSWFGRAADSTRIFCRESFTHPIYLWVYFIRTCVYGALLGISGFIIFFPQHELGMDLTEVGHKLAWPSLAWIALAYPVGRIIDSRGALYVLGWGLGIITVGYVSSFFLVIGPKSFFASSMVTGVAFWVVMVAQLKLIQEIFHPQRYSQLAGACTIVQSIIIAIFISTAAGWALDALKGWHPSLHIPGLGPVQLGPYRLVNLMLGALYGMAWMALGSVRRHWHARGGPDNYIAPL